MILYFLKTTLILGLFYLLYVLLLKNNKSFKWNRMYLLSSSILAMIIPMLQHINIFQKEIITQTTKPLSITLDTITIYANTIQDKELDFAKLILGIYAIGLIWGLLRMILGFIVINRIKEGSRLEKIDDDYIYFNSTIVSPFSFNSNIYIPSSFRQNDVLNIILKHEQAHVKLKHSRDKIYFSLMQALCWFNPFIYFYHKEIELVHEYEADEFSTQTFAKDDYVEKLLQTITYTQTPTLLAHHFFHHPLKTRIIMLYKKSKSALAQKATVIVAGIIVILTFLSIQSYGQKKKTVNKIVESNESVKGGDTIYVELPNGDIERKIVAKKNTPIKYNLHNMQSESDTVFIEKPNGEVEMKIIKKEAQKTSILIDMEGSYNMVNGEKVYNYATTMPEYPGGETALIKYLSENLQYPALDKKNKTEGFLMMNFTVNENGELTYIKAQSKSKTTSDAMEKEAIRVIKSMPKWNAGRSDVKAVKVSYLLPVRFKL